jgi:N-acetyl-anhydromuramyl-L-alanine amidase AmpD
MIHHALHNNCTIQDIHKWHIENGWSGIGYHYFIDKTGKIFKGRKDSWNGAHCKENNMNTQSIGVCLEGCYTDYNNMTEKTVPQAQIRALIDLCVYLNLPVVYHRDYASYKDCPGKYFLSKDELNKLIKAKEISKWEQYVDECSQYPEDWKKIIKEEIYKNTKFRYLPELICNLYNHKK